MNPRLYIHLWLRRQLAAKENFSNSLFLLHPSPRNLLKSVCRLLLHLFPFLSSLFPVLHFMKHLWSLISSSSSSSSQSSFINLLLNPPESWPAVLASLLRHTLIDSNKPSSHLNLRRTATTMHCTAFWLAICIKTFCGDAPNAGSFWKPARPDETQREPRWEIWTISRLVTLKNMFYSFNSSLCCFLISHDELASSLLIPSSQPCPINTMLP